MMLTNFERSVIQYITEHEAPELVASLSGIDVLSRSHSGSGYYVNFIEKNSAPSKDGKDITLGKSVYADIDGMKYGTGFMLFVDNGMISTLEIFSHANEDIPKTITEFKLSYI